MKQVSKETRSLTFLFWGFALCVIGRPRWFTKAKGDYTKQKLSKSSCTANKCIPQQNPGLNFGIHSSKLSLYVGQGERAGVTTTSHFNVWLDNVPFC